MTSSSTRDSSRPSSAGSRQSLSTSLQKTGCSGSRAELSTLTQVGSTKPSSVWRWQSVRRGMSAMGRSRQVRWPRSAAYLRLLRGDLGASAAKPAIAARNRGGAVRIVQHDPHAHPSDLLKARCGLARRSGRARPRARPPLASAITQGECRLRDDYSRTCLGRFRRAIQTHERGSVPCRR
jgi:hypothetical protein